MKVYLVFDRYYQEADAVAFSKAGAEAHVEARVASHWQNVEKTHKSTDASKETVCGLRRDDFHIEEFETIP